MNSIWVCWDRYGKYVAEFKVQLGGRLYVYTSKGNVTRSAFSLDQMFAYEGGSVNIQEWV